jgi:hypothetical protein
MAKKMAQKVRKLIFRFSLDITINNTVNIASAVEVQVSKDAGRTFQPLETRPINSSQNASTIFRFYYHENVTDSDAWGSYVVRWRAIGANGMADSPWSADLYVDWKDN